MDIGLGELNPPYQVGAPRSAQFTLKVMFWAYQYSLLRVT